MRFNKFKITNKGLYWGLIITFAFLYLFVGFVSTLHSITFFNLANTLGLAVLLGITYEIGQASVLFSILMSESNRNKFLPWALMFLLTALQVTANVYASFKFMATSGSTDWQYWQKTILIGVQAANPEMYQIIISWIAGALLPVVALGMTALVAQNMNFLTQENEESDHSASNKETTDEKKLDTDFAYTDNEIEQNLLDEEAMMLTPGVSKNTESLNSTAKPVKRRPKRPPKDKSNTVASKKEKELLLKGDARVPRKKRTVNPLKQKNKKTKPFKDLDELFKPSKGDEAIALLEKEAKAKEKDYISQTDKGEDESSKASLVPPEILNPYLESGVEVIDAKAIPTLNTKLKNIK